MINQFIAIDILAKQIEFITGCSTTILNQMPAVFKRDEIYVIMPDEDNIRLTPFFGGDSKVEFKVDIVQIAHETSMNRQDSLVDDVHSAMRQGTTILEKCIPRINNLNTPNTYVISGMNYGTSTWVTDTKIFSIFKITLDMTGFIEY